MSALLKLLAAPTGLNVLSGLPSSYQGSVAREVVFRAALAGRRVLWVTDDPHALDHIATWRSHHRVEVGSRLQIQTFSDREMALGPELGEQLMAEMIKIGFRHNTVVFETPAALPAGHEHSKFGTYWRTASGFALLGSKVLIATNNGPANVKLATPLYDRDAEFEERPSTSHAALWDCASAAGLALTLKGPNGEAIRLKGVETTGAGEIGADGKRTFSAGAPLMITFTEETANA
ncbi:MAG TPA: hypothetical protein VMF32_25380 [Xanthobacteraceae bacterium]|nr:hypothetical protein [Xanthobacteraceae bacterium]